MAQKIHCPCCEWKPGPHDRWHCVPTCGTVWNTFETRGRCPGCNKQWRVTQCLSCWQFSPHEDWYHEDEPWTDAWEDAEERSEERVEVGAGRAR